MREELNRILRTDKVELPDGDPTQLLRMLSVITSELAHSRSPEMGSADIAATSARATHHVFGMIPISAQGREQTALKEKILVHLDLIFSRHIPGIAAQFEEDRRERSLVKAISVLSESYRQLPLEWLPCDHREIDWRELARDNIQDVLRLADRISSNAYNPKLRDTQQLLRAYTLVRDVA